MHSRFGQVAVFGQLVVFAFTTSLLMGTSSSASEATLPDTYYGGLNGYNGSDVLENSDVYSFDVFGATAARSGNNLTVTIYTNYAGAVGAENTGLGYLFLGNGSPTLAGSPPYTTDTFSADPSRFQYAASIPYYTSASSGTGTLYHLSETGSDVQLSYYGNTSSTTSPANGGYFRTGQAVGIIGNPTSAGSDGWSISAGSSTPTDHIGYTGSDGGTSAADYAGDGTITFTLADIFDPTGIDLGGTSGIFTIAWAMTCSNDVILATFDLPPPGHQSSTPLPATLPLFASGAGFMGFLTWRRKRKATAADAVAA